MENVETRQIPLMRIIPSRWQPRDAAFDADDLWGLASSIQENGLINPVVVFEVKLSEDEPWFELVAGERRTRAVAGLAWGRLNGDIAPKEAVETLARDGLAAIPDEARALLEKSGTPIKATVESAEDLQRLHRVAVVENIERSALSSIEEARALKGLQDEYGWSQRELARNIGKSQSWVAARLSLLGLSEEAQKAVSTRVLNTTHGRAIAAVPEALQPAVTAWATEAVGKEDNPATTRQIQNRARQVAAFVDPARWEPNGEKVYRPAERNTLDLIRWAIEGADMERCAGGLIGLAADGHWSPTNWLAKKPIDLIQSDCAVGKVLQALGHSPDIDTTWAEFARQSEHTCETCVFANVEVVAEREGLPVHCRRWTANRGKADAIETCLGWIRYASLVVIPIPSVLVAWFDEFGIEHKKSPFTYIEVVADYVDAIARAADGKRRVMAAHEEQEAVKHIGEIKAFIDWQSEQPPECLAHFQAHACAKCAHYLEGKPVPCLFVIEPLPVRGRPGKTEFAAPSFGVLVDEAWRMYPRCGQFCYMDIPPIFQHQGVQFGKRAQVMEWLHALAACGAGSTHNALWGVLRWLDYGVPWDKSNDFDKLKRFIKANWDALGGDGGVATLLDVALVESRARTAHKQPYQLMDPTTNEVARFASVDFGVVLRKNNWMWGYPDDWPRPWEAVAESSDDDDISSS